MIAMATPMIDELSKQLVKAMGPTIEEALQAACKRLEGQILPAQQTARPGGGKECAPGSSCSTGGGSTSSDDPCGVYVPMVQQTMRKRCNAMFDECDAKRISEAIRGTSWALYEDQIGRAEMSFQLTGAVGPGQAQATPPTATTFVVGPAIPPSSSILIVQDMRYGLPWRPGCLDIDIAPPEGVDKEDAYSGLLVTVWVALRSDLATIINANPIGSYGVRWNDYQVIRGKELYCGDACKSVDLRGPCVDDDWIGQDAILLIQIDNLDNANTVTWRNAEVVFRGIKPVCCDACFTGKGCSCGG